jgi:F1F0 ATPase subunit 2
MNEPLLWVIALVAGMALGAAFFAGLWWTVRRGIAASQPAFWFVGSLVLRTAMVLAGFMFISGGDWRRLVACLVGFAMARPIVTRLTRPPEGPAGHAP